MATESPERKKLHEEVFEKYLEPDRDIVAAEGHDGSLTGPHFPKGHDDSKPFRSITERARVRQNLAGKSDRVFFVNGVANSFLDHYRHAYHLAQRLNKPVIGVYNRSDCDNLGKIGVGTDLVQAAFDESGISGNPAQASVFEQLHAKSDGHFVGHSQGSLIIVGALRQIAFIKPRGYLTKKLRIDLIGSQATHAPDGPDYTRYIGTFDVAAAIPQAIFGAKNLGEKANTLGRILGGPQIGLESRTRLLDGQGHDGFDYIEKLPQSNLLGKPGREAPSVFGYNLPFTTAAHVSMKTADKYYSGAIRMGLSAAGSAMEPAFTATKDATKRIWRSAKADPTLEPLTSAARDGARFVMSNRASMQEGLSDVGSLFGTASAITGVGAGVLFFVGGPAATAALGTASTSFLAAGAAAKAWAGVMCALGTLDGSSKDDPMDYAVDATKDLISLGVGAVADKVAQAAKYAGKADFSSMDEFVEAKNSADGINKISSTINRLKARKSIIPMITQSAGSEKWLKVISVGYQIVDLISNLIELVGTKWKQLKDAAIRLWSAGKKKTMAAGSWAAAGAKSIWQKVSDGARIGSNLIAQQVKSLVSSQGPPLVKGFRFPMPLFPFFGMPAMSAVLAGSLRSASGPGVGLGHSERNKMGGFLGFDPSAARVHQGPVVAEVAKSMGARAFTIGRDVFLGGTLSKYSREGMSLLAHELQHVGQHLGLARSPSASRLGPEEEAQHVERSFLNAAGKGSAVEQIEFDWVTDGEGFSDAEIRQIERTRASATGAIEMALSDFDGQGDLEVLEITVEIDLSEDADSAGSRIAEKVLSAAIGLVSTNPRAPSGIQFADDPWGRSVVDDMFTGSAEHLGTVAKVIGGGVIAATATATLPIALGMGLVAWGLHDLMKPDSGLKRLPGNQMDTFSEGIDEITDFSLFGGWGGPSVGKRVMTGLMALMLQVSQPVRHFNPLWSEARGDELPPTTESVKPAPSKTESQPVAAKAGADKAQTLYSQAPSTAKEQAQWILDAADEGFVTFDDKHARQAVVDVKDGKKVHNIDASTDAIPILAFEVSAVKSNVKRWIDGKDATKPQIKFGSFIRKDKDESHGKGRAIDINGLEQTKTVDPCVQIISDFDKNIGKSYGLGMPYQGDFFDPSDDIEAKKAAAIKAAKDTDKELNVTGALQKYRAHSFKVKATKDESKGTWSWAKPAVDVPGGAVDRLKSKALRDKIAEKREAGFDIMVYPDNPNHMHVELKD